MRVSAQHCLGLVPSLHRWAPLVPIHRITCAREATHSMASRPVCLLRRTVALPPDKHSTHSQLQQVCVRAELAHRPFGWSFLNLFVAS